MKIPSPRFAGFLFLPLLLLPPAGHASSPPTDRVHFCPPLDSRQWDEDHVLRPASKRLASSNAGETPKVKLIYFIPNDRSFNSDVDDTIKARIPRIQTFFSRQMQANGFGNRTFQFETDAQGDPVVHRVDGSDSESTLFFAYPRVGAGNVLRDLQSLGERFDYTKNILFVVVDHSRGTLWDNVGGIAQQWPYSKVGGFALVPSVFSVATAAHELGHAFGLQHDFRDDAYVMSFGPGQNQMSACSAGFLAVHPYFNPDSPSARGSAPTIELISPLEYPPGSTSFSVQARVASGSLGLHQLSLFVRTRGEGPDAGSLEIKECRALAGEKDTVVTFDYDGVIPSDDFASLANSAAHPIAFGAVDTLGNWSNAHFSLAETSSHHIATLEVPRSNWELQFVLFSPDGNTLASGLRTGVVLWDAAARTSSPTLSQSSVSSGAFSPDGTILASGSYLTSEANIQLWDVKTRSHIAALDGHTGGPTGVHSLAFSPGGDTIASGSGDQTIKLWDVSARSLLATLEGHTSHVFAVAFSPDGTLASGSRDGTIKLWDPATGNDTATLDGRTGRVLDLAFSADGTLLASSTDRGILLWDVAARTRSATLESGGKMSFAPSGKILAFGSGYGTLKLYNLETQKYIATLGHPGTVSSPYGEFPVNSVAFSFDGTLLASGVWNGYPAKIELWDTSSWPGAVNTQTSDPEVTTPASICDRTSQVRDAIVAEVTGVTTCGNVTDVHLGEITVLDLDDQSITTLQAGDFDNLTNLATLHLRTNQLSSLPEGIFGNLTNLNRLDLDDNQLSSLPEGIFDNLTNLTKLDLQINQLPSLPGGIFDNLTHLTWLRLNDNQFSSLPADLFGNLTNLTHLRIRNNALGSLPDSLFFQLTNLTLLDLSGNQLSSLPKGIFDQLTNLTRLELNHNRLGSLPAGIFGKLTPLTSLELQNNRLRSLPVGFFGGLTSLDTLDLTGNQIEPLPLSLSLKKTGEGPFIAVAPIGAPFAMVLPLVVANGSISGGATAITIPAGSVESDTLAALRTSGTTAAVTVDIGTLPGIPGHHDGYSLVKSSGLPLEVLGIVDGQTATDFSGDGKTDFVDFFLFADAFGGTDARFDLDDSGTVDFVDFFLFVDAFSQSGQAKLMALAQEMLGLPTETQLRQNWPNPFNTETVLSWSLMKPGPVRLEVFALNGQRLAVLHRGPQQAGHHRLHWDGRDDEGRPLASGVYLYRLTSAGGDLTRKLTLLR